MENSPWHGDVAPTTSVISATARCRKIVLSASGCRLGDDAGNLVDEPRSRTPTANVLSMQRPDGTLTTYSLRRVPTARKTTVMATGAPSTGRLRLSSMAPSPRTVTGLRRPPADAGRFQDVASGTDAFLGHDPPRPTPSDGPDPGDLRRRQRRTDQFTTAAACPSHTDRGRGGLRPTPTTGALPAGQRKHTLGSPPTTPTTPWAHRLSTVREGSDGSKVTVEQLAYDVAGRAGFPVPMRWAASPRSAKPRDAAHRGIPCASPRCQTPTVPRTSRPSRRTAVC